MISFEKLKILTPLQNLPKNVGDLGKLIVGKGFKKLPKSNKSPNMVTLTACKQKLSLHPLVLPCFIKIAHSWPLFLYFRLFNMLDSK